MQILLSKAHKNITLFVLIVLSILLFNNAASAQWVMTSGDGSAGGNGSSTHNTATIYLAPGESFTGSITPLNNLSNITVSINSPVPQFVASKVAGSLTPSNPLYFNITIPAHVPSSQINYTIKLEGNLTSPSGNGSFYSNFQLHVKPKLRQAKETAKPQEVRLNPGN